MGRGQRLHAAKDRALAIVAVAVHEIVDDGIVIGDRGESRKGEERLDLGGKHEVSGGRRVIKRLDPQAIASAEQTARPSVPDRECEHPLNVLEAVLAPLAIGME